MVLAGEASIFSAACAAVATSCAVWVAYRDSRWRKSGLAAQMSARIDAAQKAADCWDDTEAAKEIKADIKRLDLVCSAHDGALGQVATRADIADIKATLATTQAEVKHAAGGVDRIESLLIRKGLGNVA